jgi:hypothetical protein
VLDELAAAPLYGGERRVGAVRPAAGVFIPA